MMGNTITEQVFRVISTVKNYNTVLIDIEVFEIFQMLNGSGAFGSQISMEGSMDDIIVKNVIDDGRKCQHRCQVPETANKENYPQINWMKIL